MLLDREREGERKRERAFVAVGEIKASSKVIYRSKFIRFFINRKQ